MAYADVRNRIHRLLDPDKGGPIGRYVDLAIMGLILLSVAAVMIGTVDPIADEYGVYLRYFEIFCVGIFTLEYSARLWSIVSSEKYRHPVTGRFRYAMTPYLIIDLLAILPFYLGGLVDLRFIRVLRLFRIFRVLKVARYSNSLQTMGTVLRKKKPDLVISITVTGVLLVLTSSMMYYVERWAQPDVFASIPATLWWGFVTLTTVGYGDVVPVTPLGQLLAGISAFLGVGLFALPASILASGFIEAANQDVGETSDEATIRLPAEEYEKHNERREELGLTWGEYIDRQAQIEKSVRKLVREEVDQATGVE
jgi:voltage-gated potassium channel